MSLVFLQNLLPAHSVFTAKNKSYSLLFQGAKSPAFCLVHHYSALFTLRKNELWEGPIFWILPSFPWVFKGMIFPLLQPLYLLFPSSTSFLLCDQRFLKTRRGLYLLPPVKVLDPKNSFLKSSELSTKESELFFPPRKTSSFHQGDTTDRLLQPPYLKALLLRKAQKERTSFYFLLKRLVDR